MRAGPRIIFAIALPGVASFVGGPTWGQVKPLSADDQKTAAHLEKEAQRVNATARGRLTTPEGNQRAAAALARDFKVPESTVTTLRDQKKFGYGEIAIALGLAEELAKRDNTSLGVALVKVMARRDAGLGWGQIAHEEGLKLGKVVSDVKKAEKALEKVEKAEAKQDGHDKPGRPEKLEKAEKSEKPEKPEKISKIERPERPERVERPGKH